MRDKSNTITVAAEQGIGYTGKHGRKAYVAQITGSDRRYGLARSFVEADRVTRDHFGRAKYTRTYEWDLCEGLYERAAGGMRSWIAVYRSMTGKLRWVKIEPDRLDAIVRRMDSGEGFDAARRATCPVAVQQ